MQITIPPSLRMFRHCCGTTIALLCWATVGHAQQQCLGLSPSPSVGASLVIDRDAGVSTRSATFATRVPRVPLFVVGETGIIQSTDAQIANEGHLASMTLGAPLPAPARIHPCITVGMVRGAFLSSPTDTPESLDGHTLGIGAGIDLASPHSRLAPLAFVFRQVIASTRGDGSDLVRIGVSAVVLPHVRAAFSYIRTMRNNAGEAIGIVIGFTG